MTDLKIVTSDVTEMASTFHTEAKSYAKLHISVSPAVAKSGDDGLDHTIGSMMDAISGLHARLAGRIEEHGDLLDAAVKHLTHRDIDVHGLFEDLMG
ncbi:DUF6317 family protein [Streptomyces broussonetiae]|nr:DUF6317 family protein [Streptomyces broussonetiae]